MRNGCPICGSEILPRYPAAADYITGDTFEVWQCVSCGAARTQPAPADLQKYYPAQYRQYNPIIAGVLRIFYRRRVARWLKLFERPGEVFEMGCGNGLMLHMLRERGWQVTGSERGGDAARIARETFGVRVIEGGPDELDPDARFDLILLIQVLEHLDDPVGTIKKLAARLKRGGKLVIGVPNFASWQSVFGGTSWFHLDVPRHLGHFSLPSLQKLLNGQGLDITNISYVSPEHDPYGWVQSFLNHMDSRPNRLTRLLMRLDPPDAANLLHLALGCLLFALAVPVSLVSWLARRGALIEVTCGHRAVIITPGHRTGA
jgi:SAM-dependent methyltransferase